MKIKSQKEKTPKNGQKSEKKQAKLNGQKNCQKSITAKKNENKIGKIAKIKKKKV